MEFQKIIGFYGFSNSGKTYVIENLIKRLKTEGYSVAVIKLSDKKIEMDEKEKDTWRYSNSGSDFVVLSSLNKTYFIDRKKLSESEIINIISRFAEFDIIFIEGARDPNIQKIKFGNIKKRKNTIINYNDNINEIFQMIKMKIDIKKKQKINLEVNGKKIPLTEFPSEFISNTLFGMISSLKGTNKINEIKLEIKYFD